MKNRVIAVTGGIGSGKSTVRRILNDLHYATIDCDQLARTVATYPETVDEVRKLLGDNFVINGELNRQAIRNKVFCDKELLLKYNGIFFERIRKLLAERLSELNGTVFVEISVFNAFEFPWDDVWLVESDMEERIRRIMKRDGVAQENVNDIIASQSICENYSLKLTNNGDIDNLKRQVVEAVSVL